MAELGEAMGTGCGIGRILAVILAPILVVAVIVSQGPVKKKAWAIIRRGSGSPKEVDQCISALSAAKDSDSAELVRRLMDIKARSGQE